MKVAGLLAAAAMALVLAASSGAGLIVGTRKGDLLLGTPKPDRIVAGAGNDRIDVAGGGSDRVSCGPGFDVVAADSSDRISSDCEVVSRRISVDPYRGTVAQHASEAEPDSFSWGSTVVAAFQVARFADGGAMNIGFAVSGDAGRTWRSGLLPGLTTASVPPGQFSRASDPSVAYDAQRSVWLVATLAFSNTESALLVSSSRDGLHWNGPFVAAHKPNGPDGILFDKEWIACDNGSASPYFGRCYLSYSDISAVRMATETSTDGGRTWSAAVSSPDNTGRAGIVGPYAPAPQPVSLPNGTLVVPLFDDGIYVVSSPDGGATMSNESLVARSSFAVSSSLRSGPFPSVEVGAGGEVMMAWPDCAARSQCTGNDLLFSHSLDGIVWSAPKPLDLGAGNHVICGLAADPARPGRVAVTYYTELRGALDVHLVWSSNGGATWSRPILLSPERMPYRRIAYSSGAMVGDYISTSFAAGRAVAVFTLAQSILKARLRQGTYAASVAVP